METNEGFMDGVREGIADSEAGRVSSLEDVEKRLVPDGAQLTDQEIISVANPFALGTRYQVWLSERKIANTATEKTWAYLMNMAGGDRNMEGEELSAYLEGRFSEEVLIQTLVKEHDAERRYLNEGARGCPCLYVEPCDLDCTCIKGGSSYGCSRCALYGNLEQRTNRAKLIVAEVVKLQEQLDSEITRGDILHDDFMSADSEWYELQGWYEDQAERQREQVRALMEAGTETLEDGCDMVHDKLLATIAKTKEVQDAH